MSDFNDWTWADFCIKAYAYNRIEKNDWYKVREVAYASIIGSHLNPKKLPTKEKYLPLDSKEVKKADKVQVNAFLEAQKKYLKEKNNGR